MTDFSKPSAGGGRTSAEPNWSEWAHALANMLEPLTHSTATGEEREAVWRAVADFDRRCRAWHQPTGAASQDW